MHFFSTEDGTILLGFLVNVLIISAAAVVAAAATARERA
jgi:hypothetical protein